MEIQWETKSRKRGNGYKGASAEKPKLWARIRPTRTKPTAIKTTGTTFESFLKSFEEGVAKMAGASVAKADATALRQTVIQLVQKTVETYEQNIARGEVGAFGSGTVPRGTKKKDRHALSATNGLLYGKVQSGKTSNQIGAIAIARENGFSLFVVLTSDNTLLGDQTARRLREGLHDDGPAVYSWEQWSADPVTFGQNNVAPHLTDKGVVLVCTKNKQNLAKLLEVVQAAEGGVVPSMIFDDEADNASLDTNTAKAARATRGTTVEPSAIFSVIGKLRSAMRHNIYIQTTATPQSLLLQGLNHPCRPSFCIRSGPGTTYMGGDLFFSETTHHTTLIDGEEVEELKNGAVEMPAGLRLALCTFFLAFAQKKLDGNSRKVYSFLAHICHKKVNHGTLAVLIGDFIRQIDKAIRGKSGAAKKKAAMAWLNDAHVELARTCSSLRPLPELIKVLERQLTCTDTKIINADSRRSTFDYHWGMNVIVGGNRLGRGLTIEGQLVTYYGRDAKQKQADTVHQHARMFGYRSDLADVTRLFVAPHILDAFRQIHDADEATREAIGNNPSTGELKVKPVWTGREIRPTRANVLNPADIEFFRPGRHIYPDYPVYKKNRVRKVTRTLDGLLDCYGDEKRYYEVPVDFLIEVLQCLPTKYQGGSWEDKRVVEALRSMQKMGIRNGRLNVRTNRGEGLELKRKDDHSHGYADSRWVSGAKDYPEVPTLLLMKQAGRKSDGWDDTPFYVPTLNFPKTDFILLFSDRRG